MTQTVVYGVDIAVIKIGKRGQPIGRRGFAWARLVFSPESSAIDPSGFVADKIIGTDLNLLASSIATDLRAGAGVALGFEAPMWTPAPSALPGQGRLFTLRFEPEVGYGWYLQSGAAATMKALTLGKILISELVRLGLRPQFSTQRNPPSPGQLCLFEAFVTGAFRTFPPHGFSQDAWDAVTAALAYAGAILRSPIQGYHADEFGPAPTSPSEVFSHWATVISSCGLDARDCLGPCPVVALRHG